VSAVRGVDPLEHFATPAWAVDALLRQGVVPLSGLVLDVGCGEGAIAARLIEAWGVQPFRIQGVEIDPRRAEVCRSRLGIQVDTADFLEGPIDVSAGGYALAISNPPYSKSLAIAERCLALTAPQRGTTCLLLRLGWLASKERRAILTRSPPDVYVLSSRPSYAATVTCGVKSKKIVGCGWKVSLPTEAPRPKQCEACGQPVSVNTQDASEYAWFAFGPGRGGRWALLDGGPPEKPEPPRASQEAA
jgi:hypothetical protein